MVRFHFKSIKLTQVIKRCFQSQNKYLTRQWLLQCVNRCFILQSVSFTIATGENSCRNCHSQAVFFIITLLKAIQSDYVICRSSFMSRYSYHSFFAQIFGTMFMGITRTLSTLWNCRCFELAGILMRFFSYFLGKPNQKTHSWWITVKIRSALQQSLNKVDWKIAPHKVAKKSLQKSPASE